LSAFVDALDRGDDEDTGVTHASAYEIRAKLKSRQAIYRSTIDPQAQLNETDDDNFCAQINQQVKYHHHHYNRLLLVIWWWPDTYSPIYVIYRHGNGHSPTFLPLPGRDLQS